MPDKRQGDVGRTHAWPRTGSAVGVERRASRAFHGERRAAVSPRESRTGKPVDLRRAMNRQKGAGAPSISALAPVFARSQRVEAGAGPRPYMERATPPTRLRQE